MSGNDDSEVYTFRGTKNEKIPRTVEQVMFHPDVQVLRTFVCCDCESLREAILPYGLTKIGSCAFFSCKKLLEISIYNKVKWIGYKAFMDCVSLRQLEFESSPSAPHQLVRIGQEAFEGCKSLERIKPPTSAAFIGTSAFRSCSSLVEANLLTTGLTEISEQAFAQCPSLQAVSLPDTLERICNNAFCECFQLVTVAISLDSRSIRIGRGSFASCRSLANLVLPQDSTTEWEAFAKCTRLHNCYGEATHRVVAGLVERFDNFPIHKLCYNHSSITVQELRQCLSDNNAKASALDSFRMSPLHVFCSSVDPSIELLDVLLESIPYKDLKLKDINGKPSKRPLLDVLLESIPYKDLRLKDVNGKRPLDYLMQNWTNGTTSLIQRTLQKSVIDRLPIGGAHMQRKIQEMLADDVTERQRTALWDKVFSIMVHYENLEAISILEMALWRTKLKSGWSRDGAKRQALNREECRNLSGSVVVIPSILTFLGIRQTTSSLQKIERTAQQLTVARLKSSTS